MIRLRTLGECAIEIGERRVGPEAGHVFALLLFLSVERGRHVSRGTLVEHFWPDASDAQARHCLRQALYKVRLLGAPVDSTAGHVELDPAAVTGDFLELAERGRVDVERLRVGGAAFGEFLPGYAPAFSSAFAEWLETKRDFVHAQVRRALSTALVESRSAHRWADVDAVARHYLQLDPLNEEATLALAEATALTGSKSQALSMLDRFVAELGPGAGDIRLPATLLRKRIAERLPSRHYTAASDALFLGRDADLALLGGLLRDVRAGRGQACIVWGDPGIGKSRLAAECAKAAALHGVRVATVGCQASDAVRPLSIWVDVVPKLQALPGALGCSPESVAYLRRLTEHDREAPPHEDAQEAAYLHARVRRALLDLVDAIADEAPLVLVVEDVHWLDAQSWDAMREMIDWAADHRVFFLLTSRTPTPTEQPSPRLPRRLVARRLGALDATASATLLDAIVRDHRRELEPEFREWCVGVSEGNPLFLRELASQWVETGDASKVPATLASVIGERLSRLRPPSLRLLQASAILGKNSTFERLEAVTDYKKFELLDAVEELEAAGLLVAGGAGVQVRHELIARAALQRINDGVRKLLHRNSARVLEAEIEATKSAALLWDYTAHCREAGEPERGGRLVSAVAMHLVDIGLPGESASIYRRALMTAVGAVERYPLLQGLCDCLRLAGLWRQMVQPLSDLTATRFELDPLSPVHNDEEIQLREVEWKVDEDPYRVLLELTECIDDDRAATNHRIAAAALALRIADNVMDLQAFERAYSCIAVLGSVARDRDRDVLGAHVIYHTVLGDLDVAARAAATLIEYERTSGTPRTLVRALNFASNPARYSGRWSEAEDFLSEAYGIADRLRYASVAMNLAEALCSVALEQSKIKEAQRWLALALGWRQNAEDCVLGDEVAYAAVRIELLSGNRERARALFRDEIHTLGDVNDRRRHMALAAVWFVLNGEHLDAALWSTTRAKLLDLHAELRARGSQDFPVYCICTALLNRGEKKMAHSVVREYATARRERSALPDYLAGLMNSASTEESTRLGCDSTNLGIADDREARPR